MPKKMTRGKQQVLLNHLPGKTFDFQGGPIARVVSIRGYQNIALNESMILRKVAAQARAWAPSLRPALSDATLDTPGRFVLLDPVEVEAEMFPKVFLCKNPQCNRIIDYSNRDGIPPERCPVCRAGKLAQMRFIKIHRCGALEPLVPPPCPECRSRNISLAMRGSERIQAFRWVCAQCGNAFALFGGHCRQCEWPADPSDPRIRDMSIEVHRAGRTYYPQSAVLLNIPYKELEGLFANSSWPLIVASKFLERPGFDKPLASFGVKQSAAARAGISDNDLDSIFAEGLSQDEILERVRRVREARQNQPSSDADDLQTICAETGVPRSIWEGAASELLETINPFENPKPGFVSRLSSKTGGADLLSELGLKEIALVQDYSIVNATFGYSRAEYANDRCRLNPFPADPRYQGRIPIFVDQVQADALLISLDPRRVLEWLSTNGIQPQIPAGTDRGLAERAHFVRLFNDVNLTHTLNAGEAERRLVFGLLHTLSHLCVRQASLLCGLEKTSLSEYILPKALTIALYCNHRFGATIGALTALYEQTLPEWLEGIRTARNCVYDPQCVDHGANCHACTHLAETSCRFFNVNLSRSFLFGGQDMQLGAINVGYINLP